ncbi:MAG: hypothetical protein QOF40_1887 [Actinomycetota bacterium]|nr:hypothetical protein [Actinomycetota bacterium]
MTAPDEARPLLLGLGWSPDQPGGLNRYFRDLLTALGGAAAVVIGPGRDATPGTVVVSDHAAPLVTRLRAFSRAARRAGAATDVVDAHFALYAALPVRLGALRRRPLVVHFHGPWAREAAAVRRSGQASRCARTLVERAVYRRADRVVTLSGAFGRVLAHEYGVSPWRIDIVRPGVDLDRFRPGDGAAARVELGLPPDAKVVLAVRRLVARTGIDRLVDAWSRLDDGGAILVIAGDGPERARLEARVRTLGLRNVRFLGTVPEGQLPPLYRAADVCVVPSVELEGFGLVVLEALASGTPVIVTDVGGLPEAVAGLGCDVVVPGDGGALGDRISRALDGRSALPTPAQCRAHAEKFSWPAAAARHRRVYSEAVTPPTRPRVLFVDHCARLSGGEIAMLRLARELETVDAHIVVFEDGPLLDELGAAGITSEIVAMPARTRDLRRQQVGVRLPWRAAADTVVQVARLARRLQRLRPDVVHANSLKACIVAGLAARLARVPCVWHVRDRIDADSLPRPAVALVRALARRVPSAIVANSEATRASLHLRPGAVRCVVIPDPLPDEFFVTPPEAARGEPVIGLVGRLAPWKGQHVFLDAFARAFPAGGARARIVGDALFGEDEYRASLHEQVARLGIGDRVEFRGFRSDVSGELAALDVLVHASVQPEPFGQVVVEGMAAGLAVIATDAGGPTEIIDRGVDGLLVPPGDVEALAAAMRSLVDDGAQRGALGTRARVSAARYRVDVIVPRFAELYADVEAAR